MEAEVARMEERLKNLPEDIKRVVAHL